MSWNLLRLTITSFLIFVEIFMLAGKEIDPKEFEKRIIKKTVEIDEFFSSPILNVDESKVYLCDKKKWQINIFSKATGEKINTCGSQGEGPAQFIVVSGINLTKDNIYVTSPGKLSIFSKDGKLQKDMRAVSTGNGENFVPWGKNYLSNRFGYDAKGNIFLVYSLFDKDLKKIKDIFKCPYKRLKGKDKTKEVLVLIEECRKAVIYKDRLYIGVSDLGFFIAVFDGSGNKLYEIKKDYEKILFPDSSKQQVMDKIKILEGDSYDRFKRTREVVFPKYMPAFVNFFIYNDIIYVFKYPAPGAKGWSELILLDLNGKVLKSQILPIGGFCMYLRDTNYISFFDGKIYYLVPLEESSIIKEFSLDKL